MKLPDYVVAIDPSLRCSGVAIFNDEKLIATQFFKTPRKLTGYEAMVYQSARVNEFLSGILILFNGVDIIVEEQVRRGEHDRMSEHNFKRLAGLSYMIVPPKLRGHVEFVQPVMWKKTIPKDIHHNRIAKEERRLGTVLRLYADQQPDIMDAIGIGRWYYDIKR